MLVKARQKNLQPTPPCLSQHTHSQHIRVHLCLCVCVCVCQGDSHIAVLSGCKVPLRGDKSPLPCQRVLALHPQAHNSHKQSGRISTWVILAFLSLLFPHFSFASSLAFSPICSPALLRLHQHLKLRCHTRADGLHTHAQSHTHTHTHNS